MLVQVRILVVAATVGVFALPCPVGAQTPPQTEAPTFTPSYSDWGDYGLLQTPTARPGADGDFAFTYSNIDPYERYNLFFTPLPWLETGFRYTSVDNRSGDPSAPGESYKDKSVDVRIRLAQESEDFPETAIGFRDIAGTGLFSGEYLVFSRRVYDFDFSAGMGWGYLSSRAAFANPLGLLSHAFKVRPVSHATGGFLLDYFRGPSVGVFGGVEYHTPIEGVRVKLELDPSNYQNEPLGNAFRVRSQVNAGVVYRILPFMEISAGVERGDTVMLRATVSANFNSLGLFHDSSAPPALEPRPVPQPPVGRPLDDSGLPLVADPAAPSPSRQPVAVESAFEEPLLPSSPAAQTEASGSDHLYAGARRLGYDIQDVTINGDSATISVKPRAGHKPGATNKLAALAEADLPGVSRAAIALPGAAPALSAPPADTEQAVAARIFADLKKYDLRGESFAMTGAHAWLALSQDKYHIYTIALGRAARIVAADAPPQVELITIDILQDSLTAASVTLSRRDLENAVAEIGSPEEIFAHATFADSSPDRPPAVTNAVAYPYYDWGLNPRVRQQLGAPNNFLIYQVYAELAGTAHLAPGVSVDGVLGANLFNNLNSLQPNPESALPHVRSDIDLYLKDGKTGLFQLEGDKLFNIAPDWYGRVSGGVLEYMYDGIDSEVLYRPYANRLAVGLDINHVIKRDFNERFGLQNYQVTEGQLSFYYKLPFYKMTATLRVGRYLAGDKGATIELSRVFAGGVRAGIFATKTNVSAAEFGEGSFDKGFFVSFPLDLLLSSPSRDEASYLVRPLTRDGGQYVSISKPLYQATDGYDPQSLSQIWPSLLK